MLPAKGQPVLPWVVAAGWVAGCEISPAGSLSVACPL